MAFAKSLKLHWKSLKTKFKALILLLGFLAATITVCGFIVSSIRWFQSDWKKSDAYIWLFQQHRDVIPLMVINTGAAVLILRRCRMALKRKRKRKLHWGLVFLLGWGLQIMLSLPAGIWQGINSWSYLPINGTPLWSRILTPLTNWPFNAGGYTVRRVFDSTVGFYGKLLPERLGDILGNMPYFAALVIVQGSILAAILTIIYKQRRTLLGYVTITLGILFLVNSLFGLSLSLP
jgi:hypothetical protein